MVGLIHLESLELLSKQCQMKLQTVLLSYSGTQLTNIQDTLVQIKELCDLDCDDEKLMDREEFKNSLITCINHISVDVKTDKILRVNIILIFTLKKKKTLFVIKYIFYYMMISQKIINEDLLNYFFDEIH